MGRVRRAVLPRLRAEVYDKQGNMRPDRSLGIPPKYTSADSSDLTVEIKDEASQELNLVLR